ncbi:hypothetical protein [Ramlibacter albus]|uniref:Uncharacterized protein n=1 Tax=Ramlibacter albus TaxID=2079448 RepID=A0A923M9N8_9BURK|nr:hypothetical protein [Ramlibacter albus]MBC5766383.1 hypothetical protein [Ramlibacter albus]
MLRGNSWEQELRVRAGSGQRADRIVVRGKTPAGDSSETFTAANGQAEWKSGMDSGRVPDDGRSHYVPAGGTWAAPLLTELLYAARAVKCRCCRPAGRA